MWMLVFALSALAAEPPLTGRYVLDEPAEALAAAHSAAVEDAVGQLPWAFRPVARPVLNRVVRSCQRLELQLEPSSFQLRCDDRDPFRHERGGKRDMKGEDGEPVEVALVTTAAQATLSFTSAQGGQRTTYAPEGERLRVTTELFGERLSKPVSWTVRYRRAD